MPASVLLPHDLQLLTRLKDNINAADRGIVDAQAQLTRASIQAQAAGMAMNVFMEHVAEVYGLKPQDVIDAGGNIRLVDPGWAMEAAMQRQAEAMQQAEAAPEAPAELEESAPVEPPPSTEPETEVRVTRVEEEEPEILPTLAMPVPVPAQKPTPRRARAH